MSENKVINDKLQGSVATYLRCDRVVSDQIKKVYCWVCQWKLFKSGMHFLRGVVARHTKCTRQPRSRFNFAKYSLGVWHHVQRVIWFLITSSLQVYQDIFQWKMCKLVKIWQNYRHEFVALRFWPTLYIDIKLRSRCCRWWAANAWPLWAHMTSTTKPEMHNS